MRLTAFFKLYKICILLHRCNLNFFAKNRFEKLRISQNFWKFSQILANSTNFWKKCDFGAVQRSALCRSRRELSNAYLLATFGFDTAENEPSKVPAHSCIFPLRNTFSNRFFAKIWDRSGAKGCKSCRAWKMLSNAYFLAKFRFDTAENEPAKNLQNFRKMHFSKMHFSTKQVTAARWRLPPVHFDSLNVGRCLFASTLTQAFLRLLHQATAKSGS